MEKNDDKDIILTKRVLWGLLILWLVGMGALLMTQCSAPACEPAAPTLKELILSEDVVNVDEPERKSVYPEYPDKITPQYACGYTWEEIFEKRRSMANGERIDYPLLYTWVKLYLDFWYKGDYQYIGSGVYGREPEGNVWNKRILPIIMACSSFDQGKEFYWRPMLHIDKKGDKFWLEYNWVQYPYGKMDYEWLFKSLSGQGFKEYVCSEIGYDEFNTGNYKIYVANFPGMSEKFDEYGFCWSGDSYNDGNGYLSEVICDAEELRKSYEEARKIMDEKGIK